MNDLVSPNEVLILVGTLIAISFLIPIGWIMIQGIKLVWRKLTQLLTKEGIL